MWKRTSKGIQILSHAGKALSGNNLSFEEAKKRTRQIEFFKNAKAKVGGVKR